MTFSYVLTTNIGKVRFEIGDRTQNAGVRPDNSNFSDEEITAVLEQESNDINAAVARLLEVLAREWAQVADITIGPRKESFSSVSKRYMEMARQMRERIGTAYTNANVKFLRNDQDYQNWLQIQGLPYQEETL